jgi:hypothetical protein
MLLFTISLEANDTEAYMGKPVNQSNFGTGLTDQSLTIDRFNQPV